MVSRNDIKKTAGWITQPQNMIGNWIGQQTGGWIKSNNERYENKNNTPTMNNYKSNLNLTTYNSRYPGFDEEDYRKLEQGAINRGLTGDEKTQFMDEAYQYYYPQVLNQHGLNERAIEINKNAAESGNSILNGNKTAEWNMKLVDLSQTAKRVKGIAYDYPDEQVIDAMKQNIPDGENLLLKYLNDGDETLLYKAGLKKTDAQAKADEYNSLKENVNNALTHNWKQLSEDGLKYLRNYNVMFQVVDEARSQGMGQGMSDNDLLLNLLYISPELQELDKELGGLNLDNQDKRILGITDGSMLSRGMTSVRDWLGWNGDEPATLDDIEQALYVKQNSDGETWKNFKANLRNWGDSVEKFVYRAPRDFANWGDNSVFMNKNLLQAELGRELTDEEYEQILQERRNKNISEVQAYNESLDREAQAARERIGLDPIVQDYYSKQGIVESMFNGDGGAMYKMAGDMAGNYDMLFGIGASIINPALGFAIMGTDTFMRENQESFDSLIDAQTKQGVSYEDAYDNASKGAMVVGLVNTVIELGLEKVLGGVETTTANNIKNMFTRDLNKEVSEMVAKRGITQMLKDGLTTQAKSSLEEGLEEVFQQVVNNIAISGYDPDHKISDGLWEAFESGALNPMNLLAGGSELLSTPTMSDIDKQTFLDWANSMEASGKQIVNKLNPKSIVENIKNGNKINNITTNTEKKSGIMDRISDWGAEKITNTVSNQDKLYKAQEPRMNTLTKSKDLEKRRSNSDRANELIVQNGYTPTDTSSRLQAHDATMKKIWSQVEEKINGGKEIMVDLSQISDKIDEYIQKQKRTKSTLSEADLLKLQKEADALRGQSVSVTDAEALKQLYNAKINNRGDEKVSDVMANGLREATHEIGVIEDTLLSEIPGEFQGLKNDFGALKDTYEDVFKADMKNQRRKGIGLTETYSRLEGLSDIANGVLGMLTGKGDLGSVAKGATKFLVGKSLAKASDVDFLIEQGFKGLRTEFEKNKPGNQAQNLNNSNMNNPTNPTDVGNNPTDVVETTDTSKSAIKKTKKGSKKTENNITPKAYTREELGLENTSLSKIDRSKYIPVEDPNTKKVVFYKVDELKESFKPVEKEEKKTTKKGKTKQYADSSYKPSITMNVDNYIKDEVIKSMNDMISGEKMGIIDISLYGRPRKGVISRVSSDINDGFQIKFEDGEEGIAPTAEWLISDYKIDSYTKPDFGEPKFKKNDINENSEEVSVRDMIRQDSMPKKGISIKKQLKGVENNNVMSVDDWKKEFIFEQYSDDDLRNELKIAKKRYNEFSKKRQEEGGYYNRDQAALYLNKIDAINDRLGDN